MESNEFQHQSNGTGQATYNTLWLILSSKQSSTTSSLLHTNSATLHTPNCLQKYQEMQYHYFLELETFHNDIQLFFRCRFLLNGIIIRLKILTNPFPVSCRMTIEPLNTTLTKCSLQLVRISNTPSGRSMYMLCTYTYNICDRLCGILYKICKNMRVIFHKDVLAFFS